MERSRTPGEVERSCQQEQGSATVSSLHSSPHCHGLVEYELGEADLPFPEFPFWGIVLVRVGHNRESWEIWWGRGRRSHSAAYPC